MIRSSDAQDRTHIGGSTGVWTFSRYYEEPKQTSDGQSQGDLVARLPSTGATLDVDK
jgi:hypothetical protein